MAQSFTIKIDNKIVAYGDPLPDPEILDQVDSYIATYTRGVLEIALPGLIVEYNNRNVQHVAYATAQYFNWLYDAQDSLTLTLDGIKPFVLPKQPRNAIN